MQTEHKCIREYPTRQIDECSGIGSDFCEGTDEMIMSIWFQDQDGTECLIDSWAQAQVNYCPFCGLKSTREFEI
jgi:hypothetical protein